MRGRHTLDAQRMMNKPAIYEKNRKKNFLFLGLFFILLIAMIILSSSIGPVNVPFKEATAIILDALKIPTNIDFIDKNRIVIMDIRLPRIIVGALVGGALGISGAIMQGLFRNPLVEPGYIGVSSGAGVAAIIVLYFGLTQYSIWVLPGAAFLGSLLAIFFVLLVWQTSSKKSIATLLLVGLGVNLFLSAVMSVLVASAPSEQELRGIVFWLQGGLDARTWEHVTLISPIIITSMLIAFIFSRELNMMLLGDEQAKSSGVHVRRTRNILLTLAALMTGAGVAVSGMIGFVGLVVPHVIRLIFGPDHRFLIPASALGGASFLVGADLISRMIIQPFTIQVGVVSALIGAPVFLVLVLRSRKGSI